MTHFNVSTCHRNFSLLGPTQKARENRNCSTQWHSKSTEASHAIVSQPDTKKKESVRWINAQSFVFSSDTSSLISFHLRWHLEKCHIHFFLLHSWLLLSYQLKYDEEYKSCYITAFNHSTSTYQKFLNCLFWISSSFALQNCLRRLYKHEERNIFLCFKSQKAQNCFKTEEVFSFIGKYLCMVNWKQTHIIAENDYANHYLFFSLV